MAFMPMLWKKARRVVCHRKGFADRHATIARWNLAYVLRFIDQQLPICNVDFAISCRPCCTWRSCRCFGTKRGVICVPSQEGRSPACNHCQVEPGLRAQVRRSAIAKLQCRFCNPSCRPCCTWRLCRCFGRKRGVIDMPSQEHRSTACNHC